MITFVGAGPGAEDLITVRGQRLLKEADIVIYAGSLVNPGLLKLCKEKCEIYNSAKMTLEEVLEVMVKGHGDGKEIVRLHTGDPCLYGAIREQMDELKKLEQRLLIEEIGHICSEKDVKELFSCDAYYGDTSPIIQEFRNAGKPVMIMDYRV